MILLPASLILTVAITPAFAKGDVPLTVQPSEAKARTKDWQSVAVKPTKPREFIGITHEADPSCLGREPIPRVLTVHGGVHQIERQVRHVKTGQILQLVPVSSSQDVQFGYNNSAARTWGYEHYIAVEPDTLAVYPAEVVRFVQQHSRLDGSRWEEQAWTFGCMLSDADHSPRTSVGVASEADFLAEQEDRNHAMADLARIEAARSKQQMERERPLKSQIGASICKPDRRVLLQGFTEGVSPDNGKIQIRVWRASYPNNGRPSSLTPSDFQPTVIWDDPDNWMQCEN